MGTGRGRWRRHSGAYIPIAEFLREQFVFIGLSKGVRARGAGIKILDGNEPPEVISFRLLFHYPSRENSYFFYVMLISFSVCHRRGVKCARVLLYIRSVKWLQNATREKKRRSGNCNYCIFFFRFFFLRFCSGFSLFRL